MLSTSAFLTNFLHARLISVHCATTARRKVTSLRNPCSYKDGSNFLRSHGQMVHEFHLMRSAWAASTVLIWVVAFVCASASCLPSCANQAAQHKKKEISHCTSVSQLCVERSAVAAGRWTASAHLVYFSSLGSLDWLLAFSLEGFAGYPLAVRLLDLCLPTRLQYMYHFDQAAWMTQQVQVLC